MLDWIVKKVVCGRINGLLDEYKEDVKGAKDRLNVWIVRIKAILQCLESMLKKLDDNELSPNEAKETADEVKTLIKAW